MSATGKNTNMNMKDAPAVEAGCAAMSEMFTHSVQLLVDVQKSSLDMAVKQSNEAAEACKRSLKGTLFACSTPWVDFSMQAFESCVGLPKGLMDLVLEQANAMAQLPSLRNESPSSVASGFAGAVQQTMQRAVSAQKLALEVASQQNKAVAETLKQHLSGTPVAAAADSIQRGVDALLDTQKNVLEIASQPLKASVAGV